MAERWIMTNARSTVAAIAARDAEVAIDGGTVAAAAPARRAPVRPA